MYYLKREFSQYLPVSREATILDIGCGYGAMVATLHELGYRHSAGIDLSEDQINTGKQLGIDQLEVADINEYLNHSESQFDCIIGLDIIEHFSKDELVVLLETLSHALKPGGFLLFRTPNGDAFLSSLYALGDFTHECILNKSSALQLMMSCGFQAEVFPSYIEARGSLKELVRKVLWKMHLIRIRLSLFASGRTWHQSVFTPNILIRATRR